MTKPIKFRAWDIRYGEWMDMKAIRFWDGGTMWCLEGEDDDIICFAGSLGKRWDLMQYTGLKDRNNEDIYEGDIVECTSLGKPKKYEVMFDSERAGYFPFAQDDGCGCCTSNLQYPNDVKIIGNKYENPELLEGVRRP